MPTQEVRHLATVFWLEVPERNFFLFLRMINFTHSGTQHSGDHLIRSFSKVCERLIRNFNPGQPEERHRRPSSRYFGSIWTHCLIDCLRKWQISSFPCKFALPLIIQEAVTFLGIITFSYKCRVTSTLQTHYSCSHFYVFMDLICMKPLYLEPLVSW